MTVPDEKRADEKRADEKRSEPERSSLVALRQLAELTVLTYDDGPTREAQVQTWLEELGDPP